LHLHRPPGATDDVGLMRTAKGRLGVKASDEQWVDDIGLRGAKSRPDAMQRQRKHNCIR